MAGSLETEASSPLPPPSVIDFGEAEQPTRVPVQERIALETHWLRIVVAGATLLIFFLVNGFVLWGVFIALQFDFSMIQQKTPNYHRFIDTPVIASILGATTIQLGTIMFSITKFLFPTK